MFTICQIDKSQLVEIHSLSNVEMYDLNPNQGCLAFNTTDKSLYVFSGTVWTKLSNNSNKKTTYETLTLSDGNQTINVRDADKIVGYTLISSLSSLFPSSGKMSGTWIIHEDRSVVRCYIQTLENPYIKFLVISVQIINATNKIKFTNYDSRYWKVTKKTPQGNLNRNQNIYRLGKIVIIREE